MVYYVNIHVVFTYSYYIHSVLMTFFMKLKDCLNISQFFRQSYYHLYYDKKRETKISMLALACGFAFSKKQTNKHNIGSWKPMVILPL